MNSSPPPHLEPIADRLARMRTFLANERTMLAWWRTALASIGFSMALLQISRNTLSGVVALVGLVFGALCFGIGAWRYRTVRKEVCALRVDSPSDCP